MFSHSGHLTIVIVQQATQALVPLDRASASKMTRFRAKQLIAETLVRTFPMVVSDELVQGAS